jgi:hypothetical protein
LGSNRGQPVCADSVVPEKAGTQHALLRPAVAHRKELDSRFRGKDEGTDGGAVSTREMQKGCNLTENLVDASEPGKTHDPNDNR